MVNVMQTDVPGHELQDARQPEVRAALERGVVVRPRLARLPVRVFELVLAVLEAVDTPARDLLIFADLLARFEREPFTSPRLVSLRAELATEGLDPSRQIERLEKLIEVHDWPITSSFARWRA